MTDPQARIELRRQTYGTGDLGALSIFAGGFINFGYWRDLPREGPISIDQRIASQRALYELVLDALAISAHDRVLEVGCGRGLGSVLALRRGPARVVGIDLMPEQVARARATHAGVSDRLTFQTGSASDVPDGLRFGDPVSRALLR